MCGQKGLMKNNYSFIMLREYFIGMSTKACIVGKIVKSRMKWAGHMVRMKDDKLPKRAETKKEEVPENEEDHS